MKNKSFKNYYDEIQVDENLLQQIPIKKHHYYKPISFICIRYSKQRNKRYI